MVVYFLFGWLGVVVFVFFFFVCLFVCFLGVFCLFVFWGGVCLICLCVLGLLFFQPALTCLKVKIDMCGSTLLDTSCNHKFGCLEATADWQRARHQ